MNQHLYTKLLNDLSSRYGQVIGGEKLSKALGFSSVAAMKQALKRGSLDIPTFFIEGRRGRFALASDVASWLAECREKANKEGSREVPENFRSADANR